MTSLNFKPWEGISKPRTSRDHEVHFSNRSEPIHEPPGVRPSSGAEICEPPRRWNQAQAIGTSNVAAPEDGRTPVHAADAPTVCWWSFPHGCCYRSEKGSWLLAFIILLVSIPSLLTAAEFDHDHRKLTDVLQVHVKDARVNYAALKAEPKGLNHYLDQLASVTRVEFDSWSEARRIAFLCNAYNAWTLRLIIAHYPVKSIKDIGSLFSGPWDQAIVRLFGETITLDTLEHKILRKEFDEPRIHFALVCAAKGCPSLRNEAYVAARLDEQLNAQAKRFLAAADKNRVDAGARIVYLSPIFKWYGADFEKKSGTVLAALKPYWPEQARDALEKGGFKIRYTDYDWSLNEWTK